MINNFRNIIENYTGTCVQYDPDPTKPDQWKVSPDALLKQSFPGDKPFRPMFFINSQFDTIPFHQIVDVQCALSAVGVAASQYQVLTIPNSSEHAFEYWRSPDGQSSPGVINTDVITFLNNHR